MNAAISMSVLLDCLRALDECSAVPRHNDSFTARLAASSNAHSAAFRLRMALGQLPAVEVADDREQVAA